MTKILLVEDDPMIYRMYQKLFTLEGYETEIAVNGQEGLDKLQNFKPDVILLDIMMPTMNGLEMLDKLKADPATATIPTVVLTNVSDIRISNEVFSKGANLSIVKSEADPDQVIAWIKSVLAKAGTSDDSATTPTADPATSVDETANTTDDTQNTM
jgi:CheY-like chemotaxis protein